MPAGQTLKCCGSSACSASARPKCTPVPACHRDRWKVRRGPMLADGQQLRPAGATNGLIVSCQINLELGAAEMKGNSGSCGIADGDGHSPRSVGVALEAGNAEIEFLARCHGLHADHLEARIGGPP